MGSIRADAPGRINLIGEHTDYQLGFVMPCAIPQRTSVELTPRADRTVRVSSAAEGCDPFHFQLGSEHKQHGWGDYIEGLTWVLAAHGYALSGFNLDIRSDVPVGSGLSSSAALSVAALRAMRTAFDLQLSDVDLARLAQQSEVEFVGAPVGIMDQMACSLAQEREALFLDTRSLHYDRIPLPTTLDLVAIDSGVTHRHTGGEYAARRHESEAAARLLGVASLRDVGVDDLDRVARLPAPLNRRARHIITENARVLEARDAVRSNNLVKLGSLFYASHDSLRDDYDVSVAPIERLVDIARRHPHVLGARMTGGGFGGVVILVTRTPFGAAVSRDVSVAYSDSFQYRATVLLPTT
jgi:galactokinase